MHWYLYLMSLLDTDTIQMILLYSEKVVYTSISAEKQIDVFITKKLDVNPKTMECVVYPKIFLAKNIN